MAALRPLAVADLALVRTLQDELGAGDSVTARRWAELAALQRHLAAALDVAYGPANAMESFTLIRDPADDPPDDPPLVVPPAGVAPRRGACRADDAAGLVCGPAAQPHER